MAGGDLVEKYMGYDTIEKSRTGTHQL